MRAALPVADGRVGDAICQVEEPAAAVRQRSTLSRVAHAGWIGTFSWANYGNARLGFTVKYPADIFVFEPAQSDERITRFRSRDGRAALRIFATPNLDGRTLTQYRTALIQERYAKA